MSYLYVSSINRPDEKSFSRKVGPLEKDNIWKVSFVYHEIPKFLYVLMYAFNRVSCDHQILVFIFALLLSGKNLLNIVSLMLRLTRKYRSIISVLVDDFNQSTVRPNTRVVNEQNLSKISID